MRDGSVKLTLVLMLAAFVVSGCSQSPRFRERQARRDARMDRLFEQIRERRTRRADHIQFVRDSHERREVRREKNLAWTKEIIRERHAAKKRWLAGDPDEHHVDLSRLVETHPETIPDTFAKLFY